MRRPDEIRAIIAALDVEIEAEERAPTKVVGPGGITFDNPMYDRLVARRERLLEELAEAGGRNVITSVRLTDSWGR